MVFTKDRLKGFLAGILATVGTWMIAFPAMDYLKNANIPIHNPYLIGFVLIAISWYVSQSNN